VSVYQPEDLGVFYNYIAMAFESGFFKVTADNFPSMSKIFHLFVK